MSIAKPEHIGASIPIAEPTMSDELDISITATIDAMDERQIELNASRAVNEVRSKRPPSEKTASETPMARNAIATLHAGRLNILNKSIANTLAVPTRTAGRESLGRMWLTRASPKAAKRNRARESENVG